MTTGTTDKGQTSSRRQESHGEHGMKLITGQLSSFKCSGCKELGIGDRYVCNGECPYILHPDCRFYEENATHEFLNGSTFKFSEDHFDEEHRYCNACGLDIKGYFYYCEGSNKSLHPCCLKLKNTIQFGEIKFLLCEKMKSKCFYCKSEKNDNRDKCWCYTFEGQDVQAHVSCVKYAIHQTLKGENNNFLMRGIYKLLKGAGKLKRKSKNFLKWAKRNPEIIILIAKIAIELLTLLTVEVAIPKDIARCIKLVIKAIEMLIAWLSVQPIPSTT